MRKKEREKNSKKILLSLAALAFWLIIWQVVCICIQDKVLLPGPLDAIKSLSKMVVTKQFYLDVSATLFRCVAGIVLSFVLGLMFAILAYKFRIVRVILNLPVRFLKATPVMAVIIYAIIILTSNSVPIFVCFLMCFPIVYINVLSGLDSLNEEYIEMFRVFGVKGSDWAFKLYIPSIMPELKASLDLIAGLSWKSVVAAEVLSVPDHSMGYNLLDAKYYLETPSLFAWVIAIVVISWAFEKLIKALLDIQKTKEYSRSKIRWNDKGLKFPDISSGEVCVEHIEKAFGEKKVFDDLSVVFNKDRKTAIMAPSGYGKTTLLRMIAGLEKADGGTIKTPETISFLFQEDRLLPWLNIYDNLALVLKNRIDEEQGKHRIEKILHIVELWDDRNKLPGQLSGGMKQRINMARAFITPAGLLLMDEPFKGLDDKLKDRIIHGAWKNTTADKTTIMVTHNRAEAEELAEEMVELENFAGGR